MKRLAAWIALAAAIAAMPMTATAEEAAKADKNGAKVLSEVRLGLLGHGVGPFARITETGVGGNLEFLFESPDLFRYILSPRPTLGASLSFQGDTDQLYLSLSWEWDLTEKLFVGLAVGGTFHDGKLNTNLDDRARLGCRLLFRGAMVAGWRIDARRSLSLMLDHVSNAFLCRFNDGLDTLGIRYGYRF